MLRSTRARRGDWFRSSRVVAAGSSELGAGQERSPLRDRAWSESWMFHRLMQAYLALERDGRRLIDDADLDWQADRQVRFTLGNVLDAIAPTNFPLTNPAVLKETIDRGGANLVRGGRRLVRDVSKGRLPAMVDTSKFEVGGNLAVTTGRSCCEPTSSS
jgi:polyhydroxyalkanoate synthase